jgi:hypothetical protein
MNENALSAGREIQYGNVRGIEIARCPQDCEKYCTATGQVLSPVVRPLAAFTAWRRRRGARAD